MASDVKLPELGEGVTEGELIKWLVKPGDQVKPDQAIAEIMTDKATVEVPSPMAGTVKELKFKAGDVVKVESVMITLDAPTAGTSTPAPTESAKASPAPAKSDAAIGASAHQENPAKNNGASTPAQSSGGTINVKLPELGEGVSEGELIKWLVKPGDQVKPDQAIAEIMTDKATVEVPSPSAGTVKELKFKVGEVVKVESVMIVMTGSGGAPASASPAQSNGHVNGAQKSAPAGASAAGKPAVANATRGDLPPADLKVLATPSTRRLAREMNIDLNQMTGSGLAGRVTRDDVMSARSSGGAAGASYGGETQNSSVTKPGFKVPAALPAHENEERVPLRGIRKKIAENLQMAKHIIPHFTLMDEADVTELVALRESLKETAEKQKAKITYLPFVIKALIATIREFPQFNASIDDANQEIVYKKYFNIGFAADTPNGLLVPVIKNADQKSILEISREIVDLSIRARDGKLKPDEMKGATITITNIGSVGGTYATPIINHPEVAILGMYKISDKPVIKNGQLAAIKVMNFTVTADHRLIDGAVAANFLKAFLGRIQKPGNLMLDMK